MSRARDYVPSNAAQFRVFLQNILDHVDSNIHVDPPIWQGVPSDRFDTLSNKFNLFETAFNRHIATPTPANRLARDEAQAECTRELRGFVNQFLRFPPVTNVDRVEMGIPNHDTIRTDHKVVTEMVDFVLHLRNIREIMVDFWIQGESHKAKPVGYDGAVIVWDLLDAHPVNPDVLNHHTMASRTPFALHFDETQRGKTVYVAAAWQNERGILGQWSEIKTAIVP
jgi:hypothetical protein